MIQRVELKLFCSGINQILSEGKSRKEYLEHTLALFPSRSKQHAGYMTLHTATSFTPHSNWDKNRNRPEQLRAIDFSALACKVIAKHSISIIYTLTWSYIQYLYIWHDTVDIFHNITECQKSSPGFQSISPAVTDYKHEAFSFTCPLYCFRIISLAGLSRTAEDKQTRYAD